MFKAIISVAMDDELIFRSPCRRIELRAATKAEIHPLTPIRNDMGASLANAEAARRIEP